MPKGFIDSNKSGVDYKYDENGNMTRDKNKDLDISYNFLNLPKNITDGTDSISYIYDASGVKWTMEGNEGKSYAGSFIYNGSGVNRTLYKILTPEGMIQVQGSTYEHEYFLRDHLGSTRVVFSDQNQDGWVEGGESPTEVLQRTDYYPFGMAHEGGLGGENKYLYNRKELQDEQLGGVSLALYDYGFRFYDPALGRFICLDPIADKFAHVSPYNYAENRPINGVDLWGLQFCPSFTSGAINYRETTNSFKRSSQNRNSSTDWKMVGFILKQSASLATLGLGGKSKIFGSASNAYGVSQGEILPNPDYAAMDLESAEIGLQANSELGGYVEAVNDANALLGDNDLNPIDAYLAGSEQLEALQNGEISIEDLAESLVSPSTAESASQAEENQDKTNILFYRQNDKGFNEQGFSAGILRIFNTKKEQE